MMEELSCCCPSTSSSITCCLTTSRNPSLRCHIPFSSIAFFTVTPSILSENPRAFVPRIQIGDFGEDSTFLHDTRTLRSLGIPLMLVMLPEVSGLTARKYVLNDQQRSLDLRMSFARDKERGIFSVGTECSGPPLQKKAPEKAPSAFWEASAFFVVGNLQPANDSYPVNLPVDLDLSRFRCSLLIPT